MAIFTKANPIPGRNHNGARQHLKCRRRLLSRFLKITIMSTSLHSANGCASRVTRVVIGRREFLMPSPEPLLAPPLGFEWETLWTSESLRYGGPGAVPVVTQEQWLLPAEAAVALRLVREKAPRRKPKRRRF